MRKSSDTTLRYLTLLQRIPVHPQMKSTSEIWQDLRDQHGDFDVSVRSIQRDLEKLSAWFPLSCEKRGRTNHWFWIEENTFMQIPAMDKTAAFALQLAAEHLQHIMPPTTLDLLKPYFKHAAGVLGQTNLGTWTEKTRIINRGPNLIPPTVPPKVQAVVYEALLDGKQFDVEYRSKAQGRAKRMTLNPLGLVFRGGVIYLIATSWEYHDPRHYALHRMRRAALSNKPAKAIADFDLARHVEGEKAFAYPLHAGKIKLRALFDEEAALHLRESKLSADQEIIDKGDGRVLIEATVADTLELRWWLLGFGAAVEVLEPVALRDEFAEVAGCLKNIYG